MLRTIGKDGKVITMNRPIQKLFPLELKTEQENSEDTPITFVEHGLQEN